MEAVVSKCFNIQPWFSTVHQGAADGFNTSLFSLKPHISGTNCNYKRWLSLKKAVGADLCPGSEQQAQDRRQHLQDTSRHNASQHITVHLLQTYKNDIRARSLGPVKVEQDRHPLVASSAQAKTEKKPQQFDYLITLNLGAAAIYLSINYLSNYLL